MVQETTPNTSQQRVIDHKGGRCVVIAGAGSGKTYALIKRVKQLVDDGVDPSTILLTTFSKQAAEELKLRLRAIVNARVLNLIKVGTMHSVCYRYLRQFRGDRFYKKVLSTRDQYDLIKSCAKLLSVRLSTDAREILNQLGFCKSSLIPRHKWEDEFRKKGFEQKNYLIVEQYEREKLKKNYIDFDDMLYHFYEMITMDDEILNIIQNEVKYLMIDEAQDNNTLQLCIAEKIGEPESNVMLVGDDYQAIFLFRGARPDIFINWSEKVAHKIVFHKNYRSAPCIIRAANRLISHNVIKTEKDMDDDTDIKGHIGVKHYSNREKEADKLVRILQKYHEVRSIPYKEISIIFRVNAQAQAFEDVLLRRDIPYQVIGGTSFFERPEIEDVISYLKLSYDPHDDFSLMRVVNRPYRALGDTWERQARRNSQGSIYTALGSIFNSKAQANQSKHLKRTVDDLGNYANRNSVSKVIRWILDIKSPWAGGQTLGEYWSSTKNKEKEFREGSTRFENVMTLAEMSRNFTSCKNFVEYVESLKTNFQKNQEKGDKVNLLTAHKAKGKEYTMVFVAGLNEDVLPHKKALSGDQMCVAESAGDLSGLEEERRICYVAITRAKQYLILSSFSKWGTASQRFEPSRFIKEMDIGQLPHLQEERYSRLSDKSITFVSDDSIVKN